MFPPAVRADFPIASAQTYLNSAAIHPMSVPASRALTDHIAFRLKGAGEGRADFGEEQQKDLKRRFAQLIGAQPDEIAFVQNTSDGENIVVMGMDLPKRGGNVVLDELHFETSLYMYKSLEAKGVELRVVKHRNWSIDVNDMERAIDRNTRLVSMALVSNVNGYLHDARAISDLAHAKGAYVFADMVQAAGAVPVDVRAMGIDFGSAATYKWLMGERGFGFLYVRERPAGHGRPDDEVRPPADREVRSRRDHVGAAPGRGALRDGHVPELAGAVLAHLAAVHRAARPREHPDPCESADRSPPARVARARVSIRDAEGQRDARSWRSS